MEKIFSFFETNNIKQPDKKDSFSSAFFKSYEDTCQQMENKCFLRIEKTKKGQKNRKIIFR